jgi:hypothetical protein
MTDDHHGQAAGMASLLVRAVDEILGTHRLDPLSAPRRTKALAALCDQLTAVGACYPGTDLVLRYEVKSRPGPA